ncbi:hypothetical protein GCM10017655_35450 [Pseudomonas turukhanskensis]|uniref:Uncharacterized protein n=1 Tax=Pseudomonas turukhanskensis TaxID=1806536 RepID=A0A9W6K6Q5_9PSED|nr:hypothetical protein GCM10017655_35450 [Pseudomonas turukhanskensis]
MAGNTQSQRHATLTQRVEDEQEEIVGFYGRGPVHRARLFSNGIAAQYNEGMGVGKARACPYGGESG